jgi:hypothetical protein
MRRGVATSKRYRDIRQIQGSGGKNFPPENIQSTAMISHDFAQPSRSRVASSSLLADTAEADCDVAACAVFP